MTALSARRADAPDGLPDLADDFPLPPGCAAELREKGHTVVCGLASPEEVAAYRPVLRGCEPGAPAAGPQNPVLYRRSDGGTA